MPIMTVDAWSRESNLPRPWAYRIAAEAEG